MDKQVGKLFHKFIQEVLRVADADPRELGRAMWVVFKEPQRLDWLSAFGWSIVNFIDEDDSAWIGEYDTVEI